MPSISRLCAFDITRIARVDDEHRILFDEERNLDFEPRFELSAFRRRRHRIALNCRFAFDDAQRHRIGDLQSDRIAIVQ